MTPGIRSVSRPYATAAPWFPDDAVTTPPARCPGVSDRSLFIAPRSLNDPVTWRFSIFRNTRARPVPPSARDSSTGVSRTYGRMRPSAASTSAFRSMNRRPPAHGLSRYHDSVASRPGSPAGYPNGPRAGDGAATRPLAGGRPVIVYAVAPGLLQPGE